MADAEKSSLGAIFGAVTDTVTEAVDVVHDLYTGEISKEEAGTRVKDTFSVAGDTIGTAAKDIWENITSKFGGDDDEKEDPDVTVVEDAPIVEEKDDASVSTGPKKGYEDIPYDEVRPELVKNVAYERMMRDSLNKYGHEMDANAFQEYVRQREEYEQIYPDAIGYGREGEAVPPVIPEGASERVYEAAYIDYQYKKGVMNAYILEHETGNSGYVSSHNPYAGSYDEIGAIYDAAEVSVDDYICVREAYDNKIPGDDTGGYIGHEWNLEAVSRMAEDSEWGDVADVVDAMQDAGYRIDAEGYYLSDERKAYIEDKIDYEIRLPEQIHVPDYVPEPKGKTDEGVSQQRYGRALDEFGTAAGTEDAVSMQSQDDSQLSGM